MTAFRLGLVQTICEANKLLDDCEIQGWEKRSRLPAANTAAAGTGYAENESLEFGLVLERLGRCNRSTRSSQCLGGSIYG
jgi:hypothetical protein